MTIINSTAEDLEAIFSLYDAAIAHQKAVSHLHWLPFDRELVKTEVEELRQYKILIDGEIACIFVVAYQDPSIWGAMDEEPSVYLHRIVTHPDYRGRKLVTHIVQWALLHGKSLGRKKLRLDTWSENLRLKDLYLDAGFEFLGIVHPSNLEALPSHYSGISLALFEQPIS